MFLSMLTADAAAQHGHEFSAPRTPSPLHPTTSPPPRSPLNYLSSTVRQQRPQQSPLPTRKSVSFDGRPSHASSRKSIMFALPPESNTSSSRPPSIRSTTTASTDDRSRKRPSRPKTNYPLAHPPPRVGPLHLRPKVLLQLHQSSPNSRPKPAFEAIPSTTFAPRLKRKFRRVFKHRDRLGPDDVVVVRAGDYGGADDHSDSDEDLESREVVGVVCFNVRDERTEICMDDDTVWEATFMQNGGYEFVATDEHGLQSKARWVPKPQGKRKSANYAQADNAAEDRKFTFSTISPDRRRHPVIASMTKGGIDVWDQYSIPPQTNLASPLSPTFSDAADSQSLPDTSEPRPMLTTDETLRKLIIVTGIWVAFREKWSTVFRYGKPGRDRESLPASPLCGSPIMPCAPIRTVSMASLNGSMSRSSSPGIPDNQSEKHHSLRSVSRMLLHRNSALAALNGEYNAADSTPPSTAKTGSSTRSRRANSTGTAFMQRASSKRNPKRHSSGPKGTSVSADMYRINTEEENDRPHRFTVSEAAHIMLPMIEDRTPKNSGEYASSMASSNDDQPTPRQTPHVRPGRATLQVPPTYLQPNHSTSGRSDGTVDTSFEDLAPKRSKSTKERPRPRQSVSSTAQPRYYVDGNENGYPAEVKIPMETEKAYDDKENKQKKRMSMRGFFHKMKSKRSRN
ncbi:uncharacterized protein BKCO1_100027 [Diplodia corticola]|uniref:Uncharacterized protein n=1 Tax=Diplodia corticola TaxID=236234 RepID=A0A1J9SLR0_9PEZI|nr:uncharacterized protein BKCO1_100027 [Diplodia corticola]OJD40660.1 hypothetical protein BKCO1_100027 [Diplodia corticola]